LFGLLKRRTEGRGERLGQCAAESLARCLSGFRANPSHLGGGLSLGRNLRGLLHRSSEWGNDLLGSVEDGTGYGGSNQTELLSADVIRRGRLDDVASKAGSVLEDEFGSFVHGIAWVVGLLLVLGRGLFGRKGVFKQSELHRTCPHGIADLVVCVELDDKASRKRLGFVVTGRDVNVSSNAAVGFHDGED